MIKISIWSCIYTILLTLKEHFCRIGLASTMTDKILMIGWFGSRFIKKLQDTIYMLRKWKKSSDTGLNYRFLKMLKFSRIFFIFIFQLIISCYKLFLKSCLFTKTFHSVGRKKGTGSSFWGVKNFKDFLSIICKKRQKSNLMHYWSINFNSISSIEFNQMDWPIFVRCAH